MQELRRKMAEVAMIEAEPASLYLVNGEGTLHHDSPGAQKIQRSIQRRPKSAHVAIINAVWQRMTLPLGSIAMAVARESLSATQMRADSLSSIIESVPDIALCFAYRPAYRGGGGLVVIDSMVGAVSRWLEELAREMDAKFIRLCEWQDSPEALIDLLATADAVVTGRFHGAIFAILAGAPFLTVPSNTWKTEGMMKDLGLAHCHHKTKAAVEGAIQSAAFAAVDRKALDGIEKQWFDAFSKIKELASQPAPDKSAKGRPITGVWCRPKTVVLVGNGPSVDGSGLGRIVDAHDEVVRFNNFRLHGFEEDIGTRTTLWSTFGQGMVPADSPPPRRVIMVHEHAKPSGEPKEIFRIPQEFYRTMQKDIRAISKHKNADKVNPTSGFLVVRWLLENGCPRINLAGFDHFRKHRSGQHHYWNAKTFGRPTDHDGDAESDLLQPFAQAGRITYLC